MITFKKVSIYFIINKITYNICYTILNIDIELWAENIKGKGDPLQEPFFKVKKIFIYITSKIILLQFRKK